MSKKIDKTKLSHLKKIVKSLEKTLGPQTDTDVSFEYICASCFPSVWNNIQEYINLEYMRGYNDGEQDKAKNLQNPQN